MESERAVVAEAVERGALRHSADERAILALIEKRSGLLSAPGRCQVPDAVLAHLDLVGHVSVQQLDRRLESFLRTERNVVSRQDSRRCLDVTQGVDDLGSVSLESRAHQLHDEPSIVTVHDERGECVAFAVHESVGVGLGLQSGATGDRALDPGAPPSRVERCVGIAVEQAKRNLRASAPECDAQGLATLIADANGARVSVRTLDHIAPEDPWMTSVPSLRASGRHDRCEHLGR